jgi:hypothetical protein
MAAIAILAVMVAITLSAGVSQETFEIARSPAVYSADLRRFAAPLRALFGLDSAFLIVYAALLIAFANRISTPDNRIAIAIAIGAIVATAVLDMVEDHHILAMLRGVEHGVEPTAGQIAFQHTESQVKFHLSYLGLFLLGLHVPRRTVAGTALALLLTVGTLVQGGLLYAAPDPLLPTGNLGRWIGFLVGFGLVLRLALQPAAAGSAISPVTMQGGGAGATGAPG